MDNWKPSGPSRPLITAAIAVVTAWAGSLYAIVDLRLLDIGPDAPLSDSAKLLLALPMALTGVSFLAALLDWHSRIAWVASGLFLFFSLFFLLNYLIVESGMLYFLSGYFMFRTAASIARNRGLKAGDESYR